MHRDLRHEKYRLLVLSWWRWCEKLSKWPGKLWAVRWGRLVSPPFLLSFSSFVEFFCAHHFEAFSFWIHNTSLPLTGIGQRRRLCSFAPYRIASQWQKYPVELRMFCSGGRRRCQGHRLCTRVYRHRSNNVWIFLARFWLLCSCFYTSDCSSEGFSLLYPRGANVCKTWWIRRSVHTNEISSRQVGPEEIRL